MNRTEWRLVIVSACLTDRRSRHAAVASVSCRVKSRNLSRLSVFESPIFRRQLLQHKQQASNLSIKPSAPDEISWLFHSPLIRPVAWPSLSHPFSRASFTMFAISPCRGWLEIVESK